MKYRKRVFAMDGAELRAALSLLMPERAEELAEADRGTLQEELVQWLLSEGLSARHEFLLYREDSPSNDGEEEDKVWLLSRRTRGCPCCTPGDGQGASPFSLSPSPSPARGRSPSPRPGPSSPIPAAQPAQARKMPRKQGEEVILRPTPAMARPTGKGGLGRNVQTVITLQPVPGLKEGQKVPEKKKSFGEECCVECGHFCVDLLSTLK